MLSRLDPNAKRLVLRLPFAAAGALLLWYGGLNELWGRATVSAAETTIRAFEHPASTIVQWKSVRAVTFRRSDFGSRSEVPGFDPAAITANLALFLALWAATPGTATVKAFRSGAACLAALFASHVLHVAFTVEATWATMLGSWSIYHYPRWLREVFATGRYFFDIVLKYALPFALWGAFLLVPAFRAREERNAEKEGAPAPARKRKRRR